MCLCVHARMIAGHMDKRAFNAVPELDEVGDSYELQSETLLAQMGYVCLRGLSCVWGLGLLAFHVLVIYALAVTHTQGVLDACGVSLWIFMLIHLLLPILLACVLCCTVLCVYMLATNLMLDTQQVPFYYWVVILLAGAYFAVLCGVGAHLTGEAASKPACNEAVASATGSAQLLTALGWVYVALDGADLLLCIGGMAALGYVQYFLA